MPKSQKCGVARNFRLTKCQGSEYPLANFRAPLRGAEGWLPYLATRITSRLFKYVIKSDISAAVN